MVRARANGTGPKLASNDRLMPERTGSAVTTQHDSADELADLAELMSHEEYIDRMADVDPDARRRRRRRAGIITAIVLTLILVASGGYVGWALTAPVSAPVVVAQKPTVSAPEPAGIPLPEEGAAAVSVSGGEKYLGKKASGIWLTSGTDEPRPIASISKLITALVILDAKPLKDADDPGPTITFGKAAHDLYDLYYVRGATIAAMPTGTSMSQHDALATMLIPSASNYAEAVSTWAFGSQWAFLEATRRWLTEHKLTGTTIVEPTGISPLNTSTPRDLIKIAKLAAADPTIAQIAATPSANVPGPGAMSNTNNLLGVEGITGLKTGNLGPGQYNLLYTATLEVGGGTRLRVAGVALQGSSRESINDSVLALLRGIREGFRDTPLATQGQEVGTISTPWGSNARLVLGADASIFTWSDAEITTDMQLTMPETYSDGDDVGTVTWTAGPNTETVPVEVAGDIIAPTMWWRLTHPDQLAAP